MSVQAFEIQQQTAMSCEMLIRASQPWDDEQLQFETDKLDATEDEADLVNSAQFVEELQAAIIT